MASAPDDPEICLAEPPRLALEYVRVSFGGQTAVDRLSLSVAPGEIVSVLGPSGCGKSTTLRVAAGVERQSEGRVLIDGRVVSDTSRHEPPESRGIGLMFQDFALFPHLSVADNVAFGLRNRLRARERGSVIERHLKSVGLLDKASRFPHQLSGGEQQRVALARALAPGPRVMLMDEPFSGLDTRLRDEVREETLEALREAGTAVLLVTHEPDEAMRMADRIALMREGRIVQIGAPFHIYNQPVDRLAAAFFSDINTVHGEVRGREAETAFGRFPTPGLADGADVEIIFRPQHLSVVEDRGAAHALDDHDGSLARAEVVRSRFVGAQSLIELRLVGSEQVLRATVPHAWLPHPGMSVWLGLPRERCFVFPSAEQRRLASPYAAE
ncbi:MAG: ABC transporter ATP-binding protein [Pseudomonadota bacterium]